MSQKNFGVIFDCDGTLLDSMEIWHDVDYRLAERAGLEVSQADRDYMTKATLEECAIYIHDHFKIGTDADDVMRIIMDDMLSYYQNEAELKPGVLELVEGLHEAGVPMGVASSTPSRLLKAGLGHTGIAKYMATIMSVDDLNTSKREPLIFDTVREAIGTEKGRTWGVDDALYAINTLRDAGYPTLAVYDSDIAGTPEKLAQAATFYLSTFEGLTAQKFLELAESL